MSHISGTFLNPSAGRLRVTLTGSFFQGTNRDAGFPSGNSNYLLGGSVNGNQMPPLDRNAPVSYMELDYPGGNVSWVVATSTIDTISGGIAAYGFTNIRMILQLIKK
jgi:hypothetical protein